MSDLISRQDTIDRINEYIEEYSEIDPDGNHSEKWCAMQEAKMTIENMPPAQPEPSTEIQEILDYLDNTLHPIVSPDNWNVYSELHDMVSKLPSVQPERGTGAWIINDEYPQHCWCSKCNHFFSLFDPKSIHFCPNCGSEMKTCILKSQYEKEN